MQFKKKIGEQKCDAKCHFTKRYMTLLLRAVIKIQGVACLFLLTSLQRSFSLPQDLSFTNHWRETYTVSMFFFLTSFSDGVSVCPIYIYIMTQTDTI